jgi:hypothetical protein
MWVGRGLGTGRRIGGAWGLGGWGAWGRGNLAALIAILGIFDVVLGHGGTEITP